MYAQLHADTDSCTRGKSHLAAPEGTIRTYFLDKSVTQSRVLSSGLAAHETCLYVSREGATLPSLRVPAHVVKEGQGQN